MDDEDLVPGQDWQAEIQRAVRTSEVVIVCLSTCAVNKEGFVQKEIKFALDCAKQKTAGDYIRNPGKVGGVRATGEPKSLALGEHYRTDWLR